MIRRLGARRFRNLAPFEVDLGPGTTLLLGATGAGKTSVLEAIYLVATTKSFRTSSLADCRSGGGSGDASDSKVGFEEGQDRASLLVTAEVDSSHRSTLEIGWSEASGLWRSLNGNPATVAEYLEVLPALAWSSGDNETLVGAPALRRRLLDRGVVGVQPLAVEALARYRRALAHKRRLLAAGRGSDETLDAWNQILATSGAEIARRRQRFVAALATALVEVEASSDLGWPPLTLSYRPSLGDRCADPSAALERLQREEHRERESGRPLVGAHLDRLDVLWRGRALRGVASAGERKTLGLLLLAAQTVVLRDAGREPIALLDDLDTELDVPTLRAVIGTFEGTAQRLVSSNRPEVFRAISVEQRWKIDQGRIASL